MICIVDYGIGNLAAIHNMLRRIGFDSCISSEPGVISQASKLILPGVGAFDEGMSNLVKRGLVAPLTDLVQKQKKPLLGICLGMQLMGLSSKEGVLAGLGWLPMRFERFKAHADGHVRLQHMGWNETHAVQPSPLLDGYGRIPRFYFVHGYHAVCETESDILATTTYGVPFPSVVGRDNVLGVQFHPEKSHRFGMQLLRSFAEMA